MNTLTKHRILEKGDEYLKGDKWLPVPASDLGLQIMYTKYGEVRRPKEEPPKTLPEKPEEGYRPTEQRECAVSPTPISPDSGAVTLPDGLEKSDKGTEIPAKAESEQSPVPTHSGTGVVTLPTIVSKKAHAWPPPEGAAPATSPTGVAEYKFPDNSPPTIWIGRNGTFYSKGLHLQVIEDLDEKDNIIQIRPKGSRGLAKNALIEFPATIIPELVDWLLRMQTTPK